MIEVGKVEEEIPSRLDENKEETEEERKNERRRRTINLSSVVISMGGMIRVEEKGRVQKIGENFIEWSYSSIWLVKRRACERFLKELYPIYMG